MLRTNQKNIRSRFCGALAGAARAAELVNKVAFDSKPNAVATAGYLNVSPN